MRTETLKMALTQCAKDVVYCYTSTGLKVINTQTLYRHTVDALKYKYGGDVGVGITKRYMREIKFRAFDGEKMTYWTMNDLCTWDSKDEKPSALADWMQYTGLNDKNGKEIWEGDIYEYQHVLGKEYWNVDKVEWQENMAGWGIDKRDSKLSVVIGNIYETPELLA